MAENKEKEMLSAMLEGQETLRMLRRMERLKKLMGAEPQTERSAVQKKTNNDVFCRSKNENIISAAIPFLDREYQKGIYVIVRLMEIRRVLEGEFLETRERQEEPAGIRKQKMMRAIQPYLEESEWKRMETVMKMMTMKEIMGRGNGK